MGFESKRVLVIEDEPNWQMLISDLLRQAANELDRVIKVVVVDNFIEASTRIATESYDLVTIDKKLVDGPMATALLDRIAVLDHRVPVIIISGAVDPSDVRDFFIYYEIDDFFWKDGFDPRRFRQTVAKLLVPASKHSDLQEQKSERREGRHMDWNTGVILTVAAVSPYAVTFATSAATAVGKELVDATFESIKGLWQWISQTIDKSNDKSAQKVWESFKKNPQSNKDALIGTILQLSPGEDKVLRGYVQGIIQEIELRKGTQLYSLLGQYYTFNDLKRICSRVSPQWGDDLGYNPTRDTLARWVVNYAQTRDKQPDLIAAMLEMNPTVMLQ